MAEPRDTRRPPLDVRIESLVHQLADAINEADAETREGLRDYATDLLRGATEVVEPRPPVRNRGGSSTNPIGLALLLGVASVPMLLVFLPLGFMMVAVALVLGIVGVGMTVLRR